MAITPAEQKRLTKLKNKARSGQHLAPDEAMFLFNELEQTNQRYIAARKLIPQEKKRKNKAADVEFETLVALVADEMGTARNGLPNLVTNAEREEMEHLARAALTLIGNHFDVTVKETEN